MPKSKQRKGFKAKKVKNRKDLEKSRITKQNQMNERIRTMIQQMQVEQEVTKQLEQEKESNLGIEDAIVLSDETVITEQSKENA